MRHLGDFADGGDRTHTLLPVLDFESSASASSATSAFLRRELVTGSGRNARGKEQEEDPECNRDDVAWRSRNRKEGVSAYRFAASLAILCGAA